MFSLEVRRAMLIGLGMAAIVTFVAWLIHSSPNPLTNEEIVKRRDFCVQHGMTARYLISEFGYTYEVICSEPEKK